MSYTPTSWSTGDTITAAAMNKIENGIANAGGGGYDAVVYIYHDNNSSHNYEVTIESGSFASLIAMIQENQPPLVLVKYWDDLTLTYGTTSMVGIYSSNSSYIDFRPKVPGSAIGLSHQQPIIWGISMMWRDDDTIDVYG